MTDIRRASIETSMLKDAKYAAGLLELLGLGYEAPRAPGRLGACAKEAVGIVEGIRRFLDGLPAEKFPYRHYGTFTEYEQLVLKQADSLRRLQGAAAATRSFLAISFPHFHIRARQSVAAVDIIAKFAHPVHMK